MLFLPHRVCLQKTNSPNYHKYKGESKKKIINQNLYFAAIISDTPAIIYRWTEEFPGRVSAKMTCAFSQV